MFKQEESLQLFFCYAREDEELRLQIERHLSPLKHRNLISSWHDRRISAGEDWGRLIEDRLSNADLIALLISAAFLSSNYCYDKEMKRALERHRTGEARVIPIILRPVDWKESPFAHLQALPTDGIPVTQWPDRDQAFLEITHGIKKAAVELIHLRKEVQSLAKSKNPESQTGAQGRVIDGLLVEIKKKDQKIDSLQQQIQAQNAEYVATQDELQRVTGEASRLEKRLTEKIYKLHKECQRSHEIYQRTYDEAAEKIEKQNLRIRELNEEIFQLRGAAKGSKLSRLFT